MLLSTHLRNIKSHGNEINANRIRRRERMRAKENEHEKIVTAENDKFCVLRWKFCGDNCRSPRRLMCLQVDCENGHLREIENKEHSNFAKLEIRSTEINSSQPSTLPNDTTRSSKQRGRNGNKATLFNLEKISNSGNNNVDYCEYFVLKDLNTDPFILWKEKKFNTVTVSPIRYNELSLPKPTSSVNPNTKNDNLNVPKRQQNLHWTIYNILRNIPWLDNLPSIIRVLFLTKNRNNAGKGNEVSEVECYSCASVRVDTTSGYLRSIEHVHNATTISAITTQFYISHILVICDNQDTLTDFTRECLEIDKDNKTCTNKNNCRDTGSTFFTPITINCSQFFSNYNAIFSEVVSSSAKTRSKNVNDTELLKFAISQHEKLRKILISTNDNDDDDDDDEITRKKIKKQKNLLHNEKRRDATMSTFLINFEQYITDAKLKYLVLKAFFLNVISTLINLSRMSHLPFDVVSESRLEDIVEIYFSVEFAKLGFWPSYSTTARDDRKKLCDAKSNVRGGLVLDVIPTTKEVCEFDFFMMYPSIISNYNLGIGTTFLLSQVSSRSNDNYNNKMNEENHLPETISTNSSRLHTKITLNEKKEKFTQYVTTPSSTTANHKNVNNFRNIKHVQLDVTKKINKSIAGKETLTYFVPCVGQVVILDFPKSPFSSVIEKLIMRRKKLQRYLTLVKRSSENNTESIYDEYIASIIQRETENYSMANSVFDEVDHVYNRVLSALLKLIANIAFGFLLTNRAPFLGDRVIASTVTFLGRQLLGRVSNEFQKHGFKIVAGDTDSLFVEININKMIPSLPRPSSSSSLQLTEKTAIANDVSSSLQNLANEILRSTFTSQNRRQSRDDDYSLLLKNHFQQFTCVKKKRYVGIRTTLGPRENLVVIKGIEKCISKSFREIFQQIIVYRFATKPIEELRRLAKCIAHLSFYRSRFLVYDHKSARSFAVVGLAEERISLRAKDCDWKQFQAKTIAGKNILIDTDNFAPVSARYIVRDGKRQLVLSDVLITQYNYSTLRAELIISKFSIDIVEEQIRIILRKVAALYSTTDATNRDRNINNSRIDDDFQNDMKKLIFVRKIIHFNNCAHGDQKSRRNTSLVPNATTAATPNNYCKRSSTSQKHRRDNETLSLLEEIFKLYGHHHSYGGVIDTQERLERNCEFTINVSLAQTPQNELFFHPPISPNYSSYKVEDGQNDISSLLCILAINGYINTCDERIFHCIELSKQLPRCSYALNTSIGVYVFRGENFILFIKSC